MDYTIDGGTAVAGTDYDASDSSGTLTFSAGQTSQTITVDTDLGDGTTGGDLNFFVQLSDPSLANNGPAAVKFINSKSTGLIEAVSGSLTIYNPDGTASNDGTVEVGDCVPMVVQLASPAAADGKFTLNYDSDYFTVTTDAAGNDVVTPGQTQVTVTSGGTQFYLWGVGATSDPSGAQITLEYGDPEQAGDANAKVGNPSGYQVLGPIGTFEVGGAVLSNSHPENGLPQNPWGYTVVYSLPKSGLPAGLPPGGTIILVQALYMDGSHWYWGDKVNPHFDAEGAQTYNGRVLPQYPGQKAPGRSGPSMGDREFSKHDMTWCITIGADYQVADAKTGQDRPDYMLGFVSFNFYDERNNRA